MERSEVEDVLWRHGWGEGDDRGPHEGTFFRNDEDDADLGFPCTLTIWWTTRSYRTTLDPGVHPGEERVQMYGPDVWEDIINVAKKPRHHTGKRYSDRRLFGGPGPRGDHGSRACHICGELGHVMRDCPQNTGGGAGGGGGGGGGGGFARPGTKCFNCEERGHFAADCPYAEQGPKCRTCG